MALTCHIDIAIRIDRDAPTTVDSESTIVGSDPRRVSLNEAQFLSDEKDIDLVALNDAMDALAALDERKSRVVELRFFGGLSTEETAEVLKVSPNTVLLDWSLAKAWLCRELRKT